MKSLSGIIGEDSLVTLANCDGYYDCPLDKNRRPLGPLVGYAGQYEPDKHYVGFTYANYAKAEQYPFVINHFARQISIHILAYLSEIDLFWGMPMGGLSFAFALASEYQKMFGFPEKEIIALKTQRQREESKLILKRHMVNPGLKVAIVEDVVNNLSTTNQAIDLIRQSGGIPTVIVCLLNRSLVVDDQFNATCGISLPVIALARKKIPEYRQDDSLVAAEIDRGNIIWKPKDDWDRLVQYQGGC